MTVTTPRILSSTTAQFSGLLLIGYAVAQHYGIALPEDLLMVLAGGFATKEAAGKFAAKKVP